MNKEETVKQLTELQTRLDSEVDIYNIDNRVEEIEKITAKIEKNNAILKYYIEQLADDKNFIDETPLQYYLMLEAQELENLKSKQASERENQDKILIEESIIASSEATVLAGQEEIAKLGVDNTQLSIDIRRARLSSNKEKVDACESKIASNNKRIQEIETQIGIIAQGWPPLTGRGSEPMHGWRELLTTGPHLQDDKENNLSRYRERWHNCLRC